MFYDTNTLPSWVKNVAKLLQVDSSRDEAGAVKKSNKDVKSEAIEMKHVVHNENDWLALGRLLGYNKSKINYFLESDNPALQLICDWIMSRYSADNRSLI